MKFFSDLTSLLAPLLGQLQRTVNLLKAVNDAGEKAMGVIEVTPETIETNGRKKVGAR